MKSSGYSEKSVRNAVKQNLKEAESIEIYWSNQADLEPVRLKSGDFKS